MRCSDETGPLRAQSSSLGSRVLGKGTQADLLARHLTALDPTRGVLRVEQGALLRARASHNDELGRRVTAIITAGKLVPNFVATTVLANT